MDPFKKKRNQFTVFLIGGIAVFLYELLLTIILTEFFGVWFIYSYIISLFTGLVFLFIYHCYITFDQKKIDLIQMEKFLINYIIMYFFSFFLVLIVTSNGIHYLDYYYFIGFKLFC